MTTSHEKPCDFGHYLQLNRKSKGKTLEEVSAVTKIPVSSLKQLEEQDMSNLPPPVFVKGFVRAYAAAVGADVADALQRFESCSATFMPDQPVVVNDKHTSSRYWLHLVLALILLAALASITLLVANIIRSGVNQAEPMARHAEQPAVDTTPGGASGALPDIASDTTSFLEVSEDHVTQAPETPSNVVEAPDTAAPQQTGPVEAPDIAPPQQSVSMEKPVVEARDNAAVEPQADAAAEPQQTWILHIRAIEPTWLTVSADDDPAAEMSLKPDEVVSFKATDHFKLLIGNAGGIFLTLNDRSIGVPGNSGQVLHLRLP